MRQILRDGIRYLEDGCEEDTIAAEILDLIAEALSAAKTQMTSVEQAKAFIKVELLTNLRSQTGWATHKAKVDIFLHEGFIDEAIEIVTDFSSYDSSIVHQVMEAAISHRADWVIENACQRAESIVERGKADAYHLAVEWLHKARAAYLQSDRESEWSIYCASLIETHGRKRNFMGLLKSLN